MKVTVKFFTILREIIGKREEQLELAEDSTLNDLLEKLSQKHGSKVAEYLYKKRTKQAESSLQFLVSGVSVNTLQGIKTKLKNGDIVAIIPPVGGG